MFDANRKVRSHIFLPVANADDDRVMARILDQYRPDRVTRLDARKGDKGPDETPIEESATVETDCYGTVSAVFPCAKERINPFRDVVQRVFSVAGAVTENAISVHSHDGPSLVQFFSGDCSPVLVTGSDLPVFALSREDDT